MPSLDLFSLNGRNVLITGAGGAIGSILARAMSEAGATVGLQDLDSEMIRESKRAIEASGGKAFIFAADLTDVNLCSELVSNVVSMMGSIDILVNCAGINRRKPISDVTVEDFNSIVAVNMRAIYFLSQAAYPFMKAQAYGTIVNVGSLTARYSFMSGSVYAATKAATSSITRSCALEWAKDGIRVNCIEPGYVKTNFTRPVWDNPKRNEWFNNLIPMGRLALPEELIGPVIFLASEASSYMTGQSILIDGGLLSGADPNH